MGFLASSKLTEMGWRLALGLAFVLASTAHAERLSDADLARKSEAGHITGFPLFAYSVDFGFGGGARGYYFWNGRRGDPRFAETPYLHRVFLQVFASTKGVQFHWLDYDGPRLFDTAYRPRAQLVFARNTDANYFGLDDDNRRLRFPGAANTFDNYDDYAAAQQQVASGVAYTKYDQVDVLRPSLIASVERSFFRERVRVLAGAGFSYARIRDYTGTQVRAVDAGMDTTATMAPTRFREDCDAGEVVGCSGGRDNYVRVGISYDTRDFEPDPNSGVFLDAELDAGTVVLGSEYDYARILVAARGFWSPFSTDLVFAGRVFGVLQSEGTPFFTMNILPFTEDPRFGLGGHRTMRGFRQDRFVDHVMTAASAEVRWTFARTTLRRQKLAFIVAPFFDVGRAFDDLGALTVRGFRPSAGGALRVSWNLSTLVTFDYGICAEGSGFYVNFGHMF